MLLQECDAMCYVDYGGILSAVRCQPSWGDHQVCGHTHGPVNPRELWWVHGHEHCAVGMHATFNQQVQLCKCFSLGEVLCRICAESYMNTVEMEVSIHRSRNSGSLVVRGLPETWSDYQRERHTLFCLNLGLRYI